jgi:hypothetical protein
VVDALISDCLQSGSAALFEGFQTLHLLRGRAIADSDVAARKLWAGHSVCANFTRRKARVHRETAI